VRPWHPVHDDTTSAFVTVDDDVQDCDRAAGVPPVQPDGDEDVIVLVCVPLVHVPQAE